MRDCPNGEVRDLLPAFVHDRLDQAAAARVREHLATCEDCDVEVAVLRSLRDELHEPVPVDVAAVTAAVVARTTGAMRVVGGTEAGATARPARSAPPVWSRTWLKAAALVVMVGGGSWVVVQSTGPGTGPGQPAPQGPVVAVASEADGLGFAGGVADLADGELQELEAAVAALEQQAIGDVESSSDWDVTTSTGGR